MNILSSTMALANIYPMGCVPMKEQSKKGYDHHIPWF